MIDKGEARRAVFIFVSAVIIVVLVVKGFITNAIEKNDWNDFLSRLDYLYVDIDGSGQIDDSEKRWENFVVLSDATGDKAVEFEDGEGFIRNGLREDYDVSLVASQDRDPSSVRLIVREDEMSSVSQASYGDLGNGNSRYGFGYDVLRYLIYDVKTGKTTTVMCTGDRGREPPDSLSGNDYASVDKSACRDMLDAEMDRLIENK